MERHPPQLAYDMLRHMPCLEPALNILFCHREPCDSVGYPRSLKGEEVALLQRPKIDYAQAGVPGICNLNKRAQ